MVRRLVLGSLIAIAALAATPLPVSGFADHTHQEFAEINRRLAVVELELHETAVARIIAYQRLATVEALVADVRDTLRWFLGLISALTVALVVNLLQVRAVHREIHNGLNGPPKSGGGSRAN